MSEELSILSLVLQAGPVVQLVMATLVLASVFSWVVIFQRTSLLSRAQKHARLFEDTFWSGAELVGLYKQVANSPNLIGLRQFLRRFQEFTRLRQDVKSDPDAVMEVSIAQCECARKGRERLKRTCRFSRRLDQLAHTGLFGTVWGIMNSFRGWQPSSGNLGTVAQGFLKPWLRQRLVYLLRFRR